MNGIIDDETLSYWESQIQYDKTNDTMTTVIVYVFNSKLLLSFKGVDKDIKYFLFFFCGKSRRYTAGRLFFPILFQWGVCSWIS